jgi:hypothetical protein
MLEPDSGTSPTDILFLNIDLLQDYPPDANLQSLHPDLYKTFEKCLQRMFRAYMAPHGPLNLYSYWPRSGLPPDLGRCTHISRFTTHYTIGPKLYISQVRQEYFPRCNTN